MTRIIVGYVPCDIEVVMLEVLIFLRVYQTDGY